MTLIDIISKMTSINGGSLERVIVTWTIDYGEETTKDIDSFMNIGEYDENEKYPYLRIINKGYSDELAEQFVQRGEVILRNPMWTEELLNGPYDPNEYEDVDSTDHVGLGFHGDLESIPYIPLEIELSGGTRGSFYGLMIDWSNFVESDDGITTSKERFEIFDYNKDNVSETDTDTFELLTNGEEMEQALNEYLPLLREDEQKFLEFREVYRWNSAMKAVLIGEAMEDALRGYGLRIPLKQTRLGPMAVGEPAKKTYGWQGGSMYHKEEEYESAQENAPHIAEFIGDFGRPFYNDSDLVYIYFLQNEEVPSLKSLEMLQEDNVAGLWFDTHDHDEYGIHLRHGLVMTAEEE